MVALVLCAHTSSMTVIFWDMLTSVELSEHNACGKSGLVFP